MAVTGNPSHDEKVTKFDPDSPRAQAYRRSMSAAYEEFQKAHLAYENALSLADPLNSASIVALRQAGREYAKAVVRHSHVVMEWLAMVDRIR